MCDFFFDPTCQLSARTEKKAHNDYHRAIPSHLGDQTSWDFVLRSGGFVHHHMMPWGIYTVADPTKRLDYCHVVSNDPTLLVTLDQVSDSLGKRSTSEALMITHALLSYKEKATGIFRRTLLHHHEAFSINIDNEDISTPALSGMPLTGIF